MQYYSSWSVSTSRVFIILSSIAHFASAIAIERTSSAYPSNITLPFPPATTSDAEPLSILSNGDGIVLDRCKLDDFETITDSCSITTPKHGSSVIIIPRDAHSNSAPRTSDTTSWSGIKLPLSTGSNVSSTHRTAPSSGIKPYLNTTGSTNSSSIKLPFNTGSNVRGTYRTAPSSGIKPYLNTTGSTNSSSIKLPLNTGSNVRGSHITASSSGIKPNLSTASSTTSSSSTKSKRKTGSGVRGAGGTTSSSGIKPPRNTAVSTTSSFGIKPARSTSSGVRGTSSTSSSSTATVTSHNCSSSSNSSLPIVALGTPVIVTSTVVESGTTLLVPVIIGGSFSFPITLPPVTTTLASSQATSSVSSVSSEIAALIPIIISWKTNPTKFKSITLKKIKGVKVDVDDLISDLGGRSSHSGCGSKRKRGLLSFFTGIVNTLTCIEEDLEDITEKITGNNVDGIKDALTDLTAENQDLDNENDDDGDDNSKSDSDSSSDESTSTTSSQTETLCAPDTCGNACTMGGGPLSGAIMGVVATAVNCQLFSTLTTSALPTASYGVVGSSKRSSFSSELVDGNNTLVDRSLAKRNPSDVEDLIRKTTWVDQDKELGEITAEWFPFPNAEITAAGANELYGCTAVFIVSEKGVYVAHLWEIPFFMTKEYNPPDDNTFTSETIDILRSGSFFTQSITALLGTDQEPGPLHTTYAPQVFVVTPFTTDAQRAKQGITTELRYEARAQQIASDLLAGHSGSTVGYTRTNREAVSGLGTAGKAILEYRQSEYWLTTPHGAGEGVLLGGWRMWVEDRLIKLQVLWGPPPAGTIQQRDLTYTNPCSNYNGDGGDSGPPPAFIETMSNGVVVSCASSTISKDAVTTTTMCAGPTKVIATITSIYNAYMTPAPTCNEGNNTAMGVNNEPASWCFCGYYGPFSTINKATTKYCDFTALPTKTISLTSHSTSVNTACVVTSMINILGPIPTLDKYCQCGETMVGIETSTNKGGTAYVKCDDKTTLSTIIPTPTPTLDPTPTAAVQCYPTHGGNPITDEDKLVQIYSGHSKPNDYCQDNKPPVETEANGDVSSPAGNNLIIQGYTLKDNAPDDCKHFFKGNLPHLQVELCALPLNAIIDACPYNGGTIDTVCGTSWITTCVLGGGCVAHDSDRLT